jgi:hypothetical protein
VKPLSADEFRRAVEVPSRPVVLKELDT